MEDNRPGNSSDPQGNGGIIADFSKVVATMKSNSQWSIEQFLRLLHVDAAEGYLVIEKHPRADAAPEAHFLPTLVVDTRHHYTRERSASARSR